MTNKVPPFILACTFASTVFAGTSNHKALDLDQDGYLNPEEAHAMPTLVEQWTEVDVNEDGRIDAVEFSRFESLSAPGVSTGEMDRATGEYSQEGKKYMREKY